MKIVYSIFISLIIISCTEDNNQFCFQTSLVENWQSEMFKTDYTIQFPDNYIGPGMISFEGNIFSKSREDSLVQFEYHYCNFNFCEDFGVELQYPLPESITMFDNQGNELELTNQIEFCGIDDNVGVFYYDDRENASGKYFMNIYGEFLESVTVYYESQLLSEVQQILGSISFISID